MNLSKHILFAVLALGIFVPGVASAACRESGTQPIQRPGATGSPFAQRDVTTLDTQTSDNVAISGGCVDAVLNGIRYAATSYRGATSKALCKWNGNTDDDVADCIQGAINAASAAGGGVVEIPAGTYYVSSQITIPITGKIGISGAGQSATTLQATASLTGGVIISGGDDSTANYSVPNVKISDLSLAGAQLAATCIFSRSWQKFIVRDVGISGCTTDLWNMSIGNASNKGMADGLIENVFYAATASANFIKIPQNIGSGGDTHNIVIVNTRGTTENGDAINCGKADTITLVKFSHTVTNSGTGAGLRAKASNLVAGDVCRKVAAYDSAFGASGTYSIVIEGTDTATYPAYDISIYGNVRGDGEPAPIAGTGVTGFICFNTNGSYCGAANPIDTFKYNAYIDNKSSTYAAVPTDCGKVINNRQGSGVGTVILPASTGDGCTIEFNKWTAGSGLVISAAGTDAIAAPRGSATALVTTGDTHTNTTLDNLASTANVFVGMVVSGTGIPSNTTVSAINSATSVTLSQAATATASGVSITFRAAIKTTSNWASIKVQDQDDGQWVVKSISGGWSNSVGAVVPAGGTVHIGTQTASASSALTFNDLPAAASKLMLSCAGLVPGTDGVNGRIQVASGTAVTFATANYSYTMAGQNTGGAASASSTAGAAVVVNASSVKTDAANPLNLVAYISNVGSSALNKGVVFQASYTNTTPVFESVSGAGQYTGDQLPVTGVRFQFSSGSITSGQCSLYALAE